MSTLNKQQLETVNQDNFPNNNTGYISPARLREFNTDVIDSLTLQTQFDANSASVDSRLDSLESFSSSIVIDYINQTELNAATASLSASLTTTINTKLPTSTYTTNSASVDGRLDYLEDKSAFISASNVFNQDNTFEQQLYVKEDLNVIGKGSFTGSISASGLGIYGDSVIGANAFSINTIKGFAYFTAPTKIYFGSQNWNDFSQSVYESVNSGSAFPAYSTSVDTRLDSLESWSSSLDTLYATDAALNASSSTLQSNINGKLDTASFTTFSSSVSTQLSASTFFSGTQYKGDSSSFDSRISTLATGYVSSASFNSYTASQDFKNGTYATTGSNSFVGNQRISGSLIISGSESLDLIVSGTARVRTTVSEINLNTAGVFANDFGTDFAAGIVPNAGVYNANNNTFDEIGFTIDSTNFGISNWSNGSSIYVNDPTDSYPAVLGFQSKATYTDGTMTALVPLNVTQSLSVVGNASFSSSVLINSGSANGSLISNVGDTYTSVASVTKIISLTTAEYNALGTKDSNTLYILV